MTKVGEDTIAAVSTPPGVGAIGIVRLSGPEAAGVAGRCFRGPGGFEFARAESHRAVHGLVVDPRTGAELDEALALPMQGPHSYTGEDVVEFHCHGSPAVLRRVLEAVVAAGARIAEPGEFTKRAFLNGRLDLAQAEAVAELIQAVAEESRRAALKHLEGDLSREIGALGRTLKLALAGLEVVVDYADEDVEETPEDPLGSQIAEVAEACRRLLASYCEGRILREGARVVIAGKPNVGKSSLLNRLLKEERAIVSPTPGTTRDYLAEAIEIQGIPVMLVDTAGLRSVEDAIESEGSRRARKWIGEADLVLFLVDGSAPVEDVDIRAYGEIRERPHLLAVNKSDLPGVADLSPFTGEAPATLSALTGQGLDELKRRIVERLNLSHRTSEGAVVTLERHRDALARTAAHLSDALESLKSGSPRDLVATDLRAALETLSEITGENVTDALLDTIFSTFCVGK